MSEALAKRRLKLWIRLLRVTRASEAHLRDYLRRTMVERAAGSAGLGYLAAGAVQILTFHWPPIKCRTIPTSGEPCKPRCW